jgi:hypothetical protein
MMRILTQEEINEIKNSHYDWENIFKKTMEEEEIMQEMKKVFLKGKAYPQNEYFFKKKHPQRWAWHQLVKKVFRFFGSNMKFVYPPDGPKYTP